MLRAEDVLGQVEMRQFTHRRKQSDVTALHSEHRTVTNATAQAGRTDQRPCMWVRRSAGLSVVPDHRTLLHQKQVHIEVLFFFRPSKLSPRITRIINRTPSWRDR